MLMHRNPSLIPILKRERERRERKYKIILGVTIGILNEKNVSIYTCL